MRIDVHNHFMSRKLAQALEKFADFPYSRFVDGTYRFFCHNALTMPMTPEFFDIGKKIDDMDRNGIDVAVLSLSIPGPERIGGSQADELAKAINDELAEIIAQRPKRFWGYASLGFGNIDASLKELDRCFSQLKFRGLQLFSNINGKPLDFPEFRPLFARLAELRRPAFIHPTVPLNQNYLMDLIPVPALSFTVDTTLAAMRLALSGVLSSYPAAPIIIPHVGGMIPYLMGRLDAFSEISPQPPTAIKRPGLLLRKLYMDTVVYQLDELKWCFSLMGAGQMLFGTDYPYGIWRRPIQMADELPCGTAEREQMLHGNAERLFFE
jgi:aminocarboxymuconate-semialdehyde decarboxylase